jgi:hypothetical protein
MNTVGASDQSLSWSGCCHQSENPKTRVDEDFAWSYEFKLGPSSRREGLQLLENLLQPAAMPTLPPEVWLLIFRIATCIPGEFDTSIVVPLEESPRAWDCRTDLDKPIARRRDLTLVSKLWNIWASDLLYSHVRMQNAEALASLVRVLNVSCDSSALPRATRYTERLEVTIADNESSSQDERDVNDYSSLSDLSSLVSFCPDLHILHIYLPKYTMPSTIEVPKISTPSPHLRHLRLILPSRLDLFLHWFPRLSLLEAFELGVYISSPYHDTSTHSLPNLHTLQIDSLASGGYWPNAALSLLSNWFLPSLQNLTLGPRYRHKIYSDAFFKVFGPQLKFLDVQYSGRGLPSFDVFTNLHALRTGYLTRMLIRAPPSAPHPTLALLQIHLPIFPNPSDISTYFTLLKALIGPHTKVIRIPNWLEAIARDENGETDAVGLKEWVEEWSAMNVRLEDRDCGLICESWMFREIVGLGV